MYVLYLNIVLTLNLTTLITYKKSAKFVDKIRKTWYYEVDDHDRLCPAIYF